MKAAEYKNLDQRFFDIVQQHKDHVALSYSDGTVFTYQQLAQRCNQYARFLSQQQVTQGDCIALKNIKTFDGYALMLACLKIGATYVNLDFTSPQLRQEKMLERCQPKLIFDFTAAQDWQLKVNDQAITEFEPAYEVPGSTVAYVMFTSGSTGFPKGATISHSSLLNFIDWGRETYAITPQDRMTNLNPIYFDNSVFDFYVSLFNGATLIPFGPEEIKSMPRVSEIVREQKPTIWFSVPSFLIYMLTTKTLKTENFKSLRAVVFGGEAFPKKKLAHLFELLTPNGTQLYNVYGPTECTCICSSYQISAKDFADMENLAPLGKLASLFDYHLKGSTTEGSSKVGELCLIGPQLSLGYINDSENTQHSFLPNPNTPSQKMYKTGDLVRLDQQGDFHFVGRADNQIKFMGYRIELEEIEAAFNSLSFIDECCVVLQENNGAAKIVAHIVSQESKSPEEVLTSVKPLLPQYMLPRSIRLWPSLPKNQNGKIDRVTLRSGEL